MLYAGGTAWLILFGAIFALSLVVVVRTKEQSRTSTAGWVYFIGTDDREDPIKIGITTRDPRNDRLPEVEAMSPNRLHVIYCFKAQNARRVEAAIHETLANHRHHGEWFDRDATLAYIDGLVRF